MADQREIDRATFRRGTTQSIAELHITEGARAIEQAGGHWSWYPILADGALWLASSPLRLWASSADVHHWCNWDRDKGCRWRGSADIAGLSDDSI